MIVHSPSRTHPSFDGPNLVSRAGLVPVMVLALRAGLADLVDEHVRPGGPCGVNAFLNVTAVLSRLGNLTSQQR